MKRIASVKERVDSLTESVRVSSETVQQQVVPPEGKGKVSIPDAFVKELTPPLSDRSSRSPSAGRKSHEGTPQPILEEPEIPVQWGILEDKDTEEHQGQTDEISKPDTVSVQNPGETETLQAKDNPTANTNGLAENSVNPQQQQEAPLQEMEPLHSDEQPPSVETIPPGKQEATPPGKEEQQEAPPPGKEE